MKKLLIVALAGISSSVFAGTGAGGIIKYTNLSRDTVTVLFGGVGCAGVSNGEPLICDTRENVRPFESVIYKYNWGVTDTWVYTVVPHKKTWITTHANEVTQFNFTGFD